MKKFSSPKFHLLMGFSLLTVAFCIEASLFFWNDIFPFSRHHFLITLLWDPSTLWLYLCPVIIVVAFLLVGRGMRPWHKKEVRSEESPCQVTETWNDLPNYWAMIIGLLSGWCLYSFSLSETFFKWLFLPIYYLYFSFDGSGEGYIWRGLLLWLVCIAFLVFRKSKLFFPTLFLSPYFLVVGLTVGMAFIDYSKGTGLLKFTGRPHSEAYNLDPDFRCGRRGHGCVHYPYHTLIHSTYNFVLIQMIRIFGYMPDSYTGYYPSREEAKNFLEKPQKVMDLPDLIKSLDLKYLEKDEGVLMLRKKVGEDPSQLMDLIAPLSKNHPGAMQKKISLFYLCERLKNRVYPTNSSLAFVLTGKDCLIIGRLGNQKFPDPIFLVDLQKYRIFAEYHENE